MAQQKAERPPRGLFQARHYNWMAKTIASMQWKDEDEYFTFVSSFAEKLEQEAPYTFQAKKFVDEAFYLPTSRAKRG